MHRKSAGVLPTAPPPVLYGHEISALELIEGQQSWESSTRQELVGSQWVFDVLGKFRYYPSESADVRQDLVPLYGTFLRQQNGFRVHAARQGESAHVRAWLDADISIGMQGWQLSATLSVASATRKVTRVSMRLYEVPMQKSIVHGIALPSLYSVQLFADTPFGRYGPLSGYVRFSAVVRQKSVRHRIEDRT
jgi:hypothetical protein